MKLTDKCLKDFTEWNSNKQFDMMLPTEYPTYLNALIIEWFDSVGIIINVKRYVMPLGEVEWYYIITGDNGAHLNNHVSEESRSLLDCRKTITEKAIEKANLIYNDMI